MTLYRRLCFRPWRCVRQPGWMRSPERGDVREWCGGAVRFLHPAPYGTRDTVRPNPAHGRHDRNLADLLNPAQTKRACLRAWGPGFESGALTD